MTWCVAHTQPSKEFLAVRHLQDQGFEVYLPQFKKLKRHARKVQEVLAPLFPRYLFIKIDLATSLWRSINGTRGVHHLLLSGENSPADLAESIIHELKSQEDGNGIVPVTSLVAFTKGQKVTILEGAFKDHTATFDSLSDKRRVELLLNVLGRETRISMAAYAIEAAY